MERYIVFIILVVLAYYLFNCWVENKVNNILKSKEGFAGTTGSTNDADVASSINTLAQIAKDLQAGGINVPGALNIKGALDIKGAINTDGVINAKDIINTDSDINAKGMNIKKNIFVGDGKQDWGSVVSIRGGINDNGYLEFKNKEDARQCYLMGKPDGAMFSENLRVNGDLIVKGRNILAELDDLKKPKTCRNIKSGYSDGRDRGLQYLNRQFAQCGQNESMSTFKVETNGNEEIQYNYTCCK